MQNLGAGAPIRRPADELTDTGGSQVLGAVLERLEMNNQRSSLLADRALDPVHTVDLVNCLKRLEGPHGGFERTAALVQADREPDLICDCRFAGDSDADHHRQRHEGGDDDGESHRRDPARRPPQCRGENSCKQDADRVGRRLAGEAFAALSQSGQPADRRGRGEMAGQQRYETDRHQQGTEQRQQDREGGGRDQVADHRRSQVDEHRRHEDDRGGQGRGDDRAGGAADASRRGVVGTSASLEAALDGLEDDDAVVDQESDADRQAEEADQVQGLAGQVEEGQRRGQADRHRDRYHRHGPPLAQEEEQDRKGDQEA